MSAAESIDARHVVEQYERGLTSGRRRDLSAFYTPPELATRLVRLGIDTLGRTPRTVLDPSCGAGAFLIAAADELVERGVAPEEALGRLVGFDIDPGSVRAARAALQSWASAHDVGRGAEPRLFVADALDPGSSPIRRRCREVELVVGNPPFASPLSADHAGRRRPGDRGGAYTDLAAMHLLEAVSAVREGAVVCMLQPQSLLGSRDGAKVRSEVTDMADLLALWASDQQLFQAAVQVCAPVLRRRPKRLSGHMGLPAALRSGGDQQVAVHWRGGSGVAVRRTGSNWSPLLAAALGVPVVQGIESRGFAGLGDLARCTAGFRDEFYALAAVAREAAPDASRGALDDDVVRLVTSGMVDPASLRWGEHPRRLAGESVLHPVASLTELERISEKVATWARRRRVPKVLVASQTRVLEAAVDHRGDCVPVTPVISVEPLETGTPPELLAAVLAAPSSSARIAAGAAGTGRSSAALRIRASSLAELAVPTGHAAAAGAVEAFAEMEELAAGRSQASWRELGERLDLALGVRDPDVIDWWVDRLPRRSLPT